MIASQRHLFNGNLQTNTANYIIFFFFLPTPGILSRAADLLNTNVSAQSKSKKNE